MGGYGFPAVLFQRRLTTIVREMRKYTVRERLLSAIAGVLILFVTFVLTYLALTDPAMRAFAAMSAIVFGSGGALFAKISITGTSTRFLDRSLGPERTGARASSAPTKVGGLAADGLSAIAANCAAFVVGLSLTALGPGFLAISPPFGMFWLYVLLIGSYAAFQARKGRRRRALLAGSLAATVLIFMAVSIRIA